MITEQEGEGTAHWGHQWIIKEFGSSCHEKTFRLYSSSSACSVPSWCSVGGKTRPLFTWALISWHQITDTVPSFLKETRKHFCPFLLPFLPYGLQVLTESLSVPVESWWNLEELLFGHWFFPQCCLHPLLRLVRNETLCGRWSPSFRAPWKLCWALELMKTLSQNAEIYTNFHPSFPLFLLLIFSNCVRPSYFSGNTRVCLWLGS